MAGAFLEIERMLIDAVGAMFTADGKATEHQGVAIHNAPVDKYAVISNIGFAATGARGSLVLVTSRETARALQFQPDIDVKPDDKGDLALCDMLGEWSNMIIGRLKNQLMKRSVVLMIGTPMTAIAYELKLASPDPFFSWHTFEVDGKSVYARLDATLVAGFALAPETPEAAPFAEGDMMLF